MKKYANMKNLVTAIRKTESCGTAKPIMGRGHERVKTEDGDLLASIIGRDITACRHVCRVFARRSTTAHYNRLQWGGDEDFISPELAELLEANAEIMIELRSAFVGHQAWQKAIA